jgi:threonine dehydratase
MVVPVLSGGNLDMRLLRTVLTHELTARKQLLRLRVRIVDEPGKMSELSEIIADNGANIRTVQHTRSDQQLQVGEAYLEFIVDASGEEHARRVCETIEQHGYEVERVN